MTMRLEYLYNHQDVSYSGSFVINKKDIVIGRGVIDQSLSFDKSISGQHAKISMDDDGQCWIEDLNTTNGTRVNGVDIKGKGRQRLQTSATIVMGRTTFRLVRDQEEQTRVSQTLSLKDRQADELAYHAPSTISVRVEVQCPLSINYSLVHANALFLSEITVFNDGDKPLRNLQLQLFLLPYAQSEMTTINTIAGNGRCSPALSLQLNNREWERLSEPDNVLMEAQINGQMVPVLLPWQEIKILPSHAWQYRDDDVPLAGFVMPKTVAVNTILSSSAPNCANAYEVLKGIYNCLLTNYEIRYVYEPRTYGDWQALRFHHEVMRYKAGTCIELALLFSACLENCHFDPLIILVRTGLDSKTGDEIWHAVIGCWRDGTPVEDAVISNQEQVRQWVKAGDILVLDSEGFARTQDFPDGMDFEDCRRSGENYIACNPLVYALDIVAARYEGITPMPFGEGPRYDRMAWLAIIRARQEAEKAQSPTITRPHLLLALLRLENGLMRQILLQFGKDKPDAMVEKIRRSFHPPEQTVPRLTKPTENYKVTIETAESYPLNGLLVTEADLIKALLIPPARIESESQKVIDKWMAELEINSQACLEQLYHLLDQKADKVWVSGELFNSNV